MNSKATSLRTLKIGQKGKIIAVSATGELGKRIRELGLTINSEVEPFGKAPLKDPIAIKVKNTILSLRNNEADHIIVEIL